MPRVGQTVRCGASFRTRSHTVNRAALENCLTPHAPLPQKGWSRLLVATGGCQCKEVASSFCQAGSEAGSAGSAVPLLGWPRRQDTALLGADALAASGLGSRGRSPVTRGRTRHSSTPRRCWEENKTPSATVPNQRDFHPPRLILSPNLLQSYPRSRKNLSMEVCEKPPP